MTQFFHLLNIIYEKISRTSRILVVLHLLPFIILAREGRKGSSELAPTHEQTTRGGKPPRLETLEEIETLEDSVACDWPLGSKFPLNPSPSPLTQCRLFR